jgi:hypothetical protein
MPRAVSLLLAASLGVAAPAATLDLATWARLIDGPLAGEALQLTAPLELGRGGGRAGDRELRELVQTWKSRAKEVGDGGSVYLSAFLAGHDEADRLDRMLLPNHKGALVLHALRLELCRRHGSEQGETLFLTLLRALQHNFAFKPAGTRHVVGILDQITGSDWQPWFERYVYGCDVPEVP